MAWHGLAWLHPAFLFVDALDGTCCSTKVQPVAALPRLWTIVDLWSL